MKEHFLDDDELEDSSEQRRIQELMDVCMDMRDYLNFTLDEVQDVFKLVNFNSSPGMDGLDMKIIQKLFEVNPVLFVDLLNKCLMDGIFPWSWKSARLVLFNKVGKNPKEWSAYRPICLLPNWAKILERLLPNCLIYYLLKNN